MFTDTSTGGPATAWSRDFGDGNGSTSASPTCADSWPGAHDVTLTAWVGPVAHAVTQTLGTARPIGETHVLAWHVVPADLDGGDDGDGDQDVLVARGDSPFSPDLAENLRSASPGAPLLLWLSLTSTVFDVLGGTLHASPPTIPQLAFADADGELSVSLTWPALAADIPFWIQAVVHDPSVPTGFTLSNGLRGTTAD
jgi:hypothetical protein